MSREINDDYIEKRDAGIFEKERDLVDYKERFSVWGNEVQTALWEIFPTDSEVNLFLEMFAVKARTSLGHSQRDDDVDALIYQRIPAYVERLRRILDVDLNRYSDLPLKERLFVEDIDSFAKVRDVNGSMVADFLHEGRIELAEDQVQMALEAILDVPFHKKDWGGEVNDLYTANLVVNGARRPTAFLLKGNGIKSPEMTIRDCGKNGDQIVRLFKSSAELFVIQYVGPIAEAVIEDVHQKTAVRRASGANANYLVIDGQDTARLLYAYNKLPT